MTGQTCPVEPRGGIPVTLSSPFPCQQAFSHRHVQLVTLLTKRSPPSVSHPVPPAASSLPGQSDGGRQQQSCLECWLEWEGHTPQVVPWAGRLWGHSQRAADNEIKRSALLPKLLVACGP